MLNLQFLESLSVYRLNLPIFGIIFLFTYSLTLILAVEKGIRKGISKKDIVNLVTIVAISSLVIARMVFLANMQKDIDWSNVFSMGDIFYKGELNIVGGYLGGLIASWFYLQGFDAIHRAKMSWLRFFDTFLPIISIGMVFGYLGIFFITLNKGAISYSEYPWLILVGDNYTHPWALYIALGYLILLIIISLLHNKFYNFRHPGYTTAIFIVGVSIIHFVTDFWQTTDLQYAPSRINGLTITQLASLLAVSLTITGLVLIKLKYLYNSNISRNKL